MKDKSYWANEFLNANVLNTRDSGEFERFVKAIQEDAHADKKNAFQLMLTLISDDTLCAIDNDLRSAITGKSRGQKQIIAELIDAEFVRRGKNA